LTPGDAGLRGLGVVVGAQKCLTGVLSLNYNAPSSPTHPRRFGGGGNYCGSANSSGRGSRQDLLESLSPSSSTSPCFPQKPGRYLPSNLYVVLYNFQAQRQNDLDLEAGRTVQILDTSDPDWWRGRCPLTGSVGYILQSYLSRLGPDERVFKVVQPCPLIERDTGLHHDLYQDQVLISLTPVSPEGGSLLVRTGENQPNTDVWGKVHSSYLYRV